MKTCLTVVIHTPKGSQNKFAYEPKLGAFVLKGVLPAGAVFPFDFGVVPSTRADDGDPVDVLVLMDAPAFVGCIVPSRLSGAIQANRPTMEKLCATTGCWPLRQTRSHTNPSDTSVT